MLFQDRTEAGRVLADRLAAYANYPDAIVLALPRGGVPVAFEVAETLNLPLDIFVVRKLGLPGHEEFAIGAIASGGARVLNQDLIRQLSLSDEIIQHWALTTVCSLTTLKFTLFTRYDMLDNSIAER